MKIDGNELAILQNDLDREGKKEEALKIKLEFLRQVRESGDHCPCKEACRHHGNCFEPHDRRHAARLRGPQGRGRQRVRQLFRLSRLRRMKIKRTNQAVCPFLSAE